MKGFSPLMGLYTCYTIYGSLTFIACEVLEKSITHHVNNSISVCGGRGEGGGVHVCVERGGGRCACVWGEGEGGGVHVCGEGEVCTCVGRVYMCVCGEGEGGKVCVCVWEGGGREGCMCVGRGEVYMCVCGEGEGRRACVCVYK